MIPTPDQVPNETVSSLTSEEETQITTALSRPWTSADQTYGRHIGRFKDARYTLIRDALVAQGWEDAHEENCRYDGLMPLSVRKPW